MQFLVISHQLWEIAFAILIGLLLGAAYDIIRFVRRLISPIGLTVTFANIFDILFGVFCGAVYCVFVYYASCGRFRWYTALGMLVGFVIYRLLPGRIIKPMLFFVADRILFLIGLILFPIKKTFIVLLRFVQKRRESILRSLRIKKTAKMKKDLISDISFGIK